MNICYYNWVDFDDNLKRGGGVTVYQNNIMNAASCTKDKFYFIASGVYYKPPFNRVSYEINGDRARIYNSETLAPSHLSFYSKSQVEGEDTANAFVDIIKKWGDVDIIHFNNLEGLPVEVLKLLKEQCPNIKIVFSVHNYYAFCPQVNLWHDEKENCLDFNDGKNCIGCVHKLPAYKYLSKQYFLQDLMKRFKLDRYSWLNKIYWKILYTLNDCRKFFISLKENRFNSNDKQPINTGNIAKQFLDRREIFKEYINKYVDLVIPVSFRVEELCRDFGIITKIKTLYIGTRHYEYFRKTEERKFLDFDGVMTIAYLGYMRKDKGFGFFLDALNALDKESASKIRLIIAARKDHNFYDRLMKISRKFESLIYYDGYTPNNIDSILESVDLGIVPPLWEDNLPQVAIELHARHIPILTSDTGGQSELHGRNKMFTFKSGNVKDFNNHLRSILRERYNKDQYFSNALKPLSMEEHIKELFSEYQSL